MIHFYSKLKQLQLFYYWVLVLFCYILYMNCIHCASKEVNKNWKLSSWWQRWKCLSCKKQFSQWWARDTYSHEFKEKVIDKYCHSSSTAREVVNEYDISSATLVKWKKDHIDDCDVCS